MGKLRIAIYFVVLLLILPKSVYAEDASILLGKYGISGVLNATEERGKLNLIEEEYYEVSKIVNTNEMLGLAVEVLNSYTTDKITSLDSELYELTDKLNNIESIILSSAEEDATTILKLDSEYRAISSLLDKKIEERNFLISQMDIGQFVLEDNTDADKDKLDALTKEVESQKEIYKKASTYPELGDITNFKSPLNRDIYITSYFGVRLDPVTRSKVSNHRGIDFRASTGTKVLAAFNGTVDDVGYDERGGYYVQINHGVGIKTIYMHLDKYSVVSGQKVSQYDVIGKSGNTGSSTTGPHLHFGVYINGNAVDPAVLIK